MKFLIRKSNKGEEIQLEMFFLVWDKRAQCMPRVTPDSDIKSSEVLLRNFNHFLQSNIKKNSSSRLYWEVQKSSLRKPLTSLPLGKSLSLHSNKYPRKKVNDFLIVSNEKLKSCGNPMLCLEPAAFPLTFQISINHLNEPEEVSGKKQEITETLFCKRWCAL